MGWEMNVEMEPGVQFVQTLNGIDDVRANTTTSVNEKIDREIFERVVAYAALPREASSRRLVELEKERDIEKTVQMQGSITALLGVLLAFAVNWKWIWLTIVTQSFLLIHSLGGWCPPVALQRTWKQRTRREINLEYMALRILRGDFGPLVPDGSPADRAREALRIAAAPR